MYYALYYMPKHAATAQHPAPAHQIARSARWFQSLINAHCCVLRRPGREAPGSLTRSLVTSGSKSQASWHRSLLPGSTRRVECL
jgi:hypothetical protein